MKRLLIAVALSLVFVVPAFATEGDQKPQAPDQNYEKIKSDVMSNLNKRLQRLQDEIACVQTTTNQQQLKECRDKFRAMEVQELQNRQGGPRGQLPRQGGQVRPGGQPPMQGGPVRPGGQLPPQGGQAGPGGQLPPQGGQ